LRQRLAAADQVDLAGDGHHHGRQLQPVGGRRHDHVAEVAAVVEPLAAGVEDHAQVDQPEGRPAHQADPGELDHRDRRADDGRRQVEQPELRVQAPQAELERQGPQLGGGQGAIDLDPASRSRRQASLSVNFCPSQEAAPQAASARARPIHW
jgi:hypothetical protein